MGPHFSVSIFWWWIGSAILHGIIIFYICMYCFRIEAFPSDYSTVDEVRMTSLENQSTLMYAVTLHVIFIKLFTELERVTEITYLFTAVTILVFYAFLFIASGKAIALLID